MSKSLTIRLDDDLADWLARTAEESGQTRTEIVKSALTVIRFGKLVATRHD